MFLNALSLCTQFRSHINKLLSSKIRVSFHSTTDAMKYQKLLLSFQIYKSLCLPTSNPKSQHQMLGGGHFRKGQAKAGASAIKKRSLVPECTSPWWIPTNELMLANQREVTGMKDAIQMVVNAYRSKRNRYRALTKRLSSAGNLKRVNKIQSVFRGHVIRQRHYQVVEKIKRDAPKKTKKYQKISKL